MWKHQGTSQVGTTAVQPVMLPVHVEMPTMETQNTKNVETINIQGPMQSSTSANHQSMLLPKSAQLILKLLNELEIDVLCNKTSDYHQFVQLQIFQTVLTALDTVYK